MRETARNAMQRVGFTTILPEPVVHAELQVLVLCRQLTRWLQLAVQLLIQDFHSLAAVSDPDQARRESPQQL